MRGGLRVRTQIPSGPTPVWTPGPPTLSAGGRSSRVRTGRGHGGAGPWSRAEVTGTYQWFVTPPPRGYSFGLSWLSWGCGAEARPAVWGEVTTPFHSRPHKPSK